jgi:hypothetical protein
MATAFYRRIRPLIKKPMTVEKEAEDRPGPSYSRLCQMLIYLCRYHSIVEKWEKIKIKMYMLLQAYHPLLNVALALYVEA